MTMINGHVWESDVQSFYQGKEVHIWCKNRGCYLNVRGEHYAREEAENLSKKHDCPLEPDNCIGCNRPILKNCQLCRDCSGKYNTSRVIYDLDEDKERRDWIPRCEKHETDFIYSDKKEKYYCPFCEQ